VFPARHGRAADLTKALPAGGLAAWIGAAGGYALRVPRQPLAKDRFVDRQASVTPQHPGTPRQRGLVLAVLTGILLAILALHWLYRVRTAEPTSFVREIAVFDTYARLTLWTDQSTAEAAFSDCAGELARLHQVLNRFDPASEVSRLNAAADREPFACSPELWDVLLAAREAYRRTGGAFDISVGPLMALWGFHRKRDTLPTDADIAEALNRVGLGRVQFDDAAHTVRFPVERMSLDFGGLAKGYALDRMAAILKRHRIDRALVDLGGNVGCTSLPPPGRQSFVIGIRNPFDTAGMLGRIPVRGRAVSTSGNYERRTIIQGQEIGHIIDPRTGRPVSGPSGVTAVTPRGVDSDVFSTAVYVAGADLARRLVSEVPGTGFALVMGTPAEPRMDVLGDLPLLDPQPSPAAPISVPRP